MKIYDYEEYINWIEKEYKIQFNKINSLTELQNTITKIRKGKANGQDHSPQGRTILQKIVGEPSDYGRTADGPPTTGKDNEIKATWNRLIKEAKTKEALERQEQFEAEKKQKEQQTQLTQELLRTDRLKDLQQDRINNLKDSPIIFRDTEFQILLDKTRKDDFLTTDEFNLLKNKKDTLQEERQKIIDQIRNPELIEITPELETFELRALKDTLSLERPNKKSIDAFISSEAKKLKIDLNPNRATEIVRLINEARAKRKSR